MMQRVTVTCSACGFVAAQLTASPAAVQILTGALVPIEGMGHAPAHPNVPVHFDVNIEDVPALDPKRVLVATGALPPMRGNGHARA